MRRLLLALLLVSSAVAAPVPKESEAQKIAKLFGEVVDEKKTCEFKLADGKLVVKAKPCREEQFKPGEVMAKNHAALVRDVSGDFEFSTVVSMQVPGWKLNREVDVIAAVGVGVWAKDGRRCIATRYYGRTGAAENKDGWASSKFVCRVPADGRTIYSVENTTEFTEIKDYHVRVKRAGDKIRYAMSKDGTEKLVAILAEDYPAAVRVGLVVHNDTTRDVECTFTEPVLKLPAKK